MFDITKLSKAERRAIKMTKKFFKIKLNAKFDYI